MFRLSPDGSGMQVGWTDRTLDVHHGGVVLLDGFVYGAASRGGRWVCLELATGAVRYAAGWQGKGSLMAADGMLYCYAERGVVGLAPVNPEGFEVVSEFRVTEGSGQHWAHPVVCGGRLYIRHGDVLMAYDVKAR